MKRSDRVLIAGILAIAATGGLALRAAEPAARDKSGVDKGTFKPDVRPQDDLFRHVSGKWLDEAKIAPDRPFEGAFIALRDQAEADLRAIIEESAKADAPAGSIARKVGDLYKSFMDEEKIETLGLDPIKPDLDAVAAIKTKDDLIRTLAKLQRGGQAGMFGLFVNTDAKQSDKYIVYLNQGGINLPDEAYYRDSKFAPIKDKYAAHVAKMFSLAKLPEPEGASKTVLALETRLAKGHWDRVRTRDATKTYNKVDRAGLDKLSPGFDWSAYLSSLGVKGIDEVVVRQPSFFTAMAEAVDQISLDDWKTWLTWGVLRNHAPLLSKPFVEESFDFYGRTLTGSPEMRPRWKRGVANVEGAMGEAAGKLYVEKHFPPAAKARMKELVANLTAAYKEDIQALDWMSEETKKQALVKLAKFTPKIGYPDKWRDYSKLEIVPGDLVGNERRSSEFEFEYGISKLGQPVDRDEWRMTPQTVNAYYNPGMNEIVFPAAILKPPFFDIEADDAVNYGGIGAVIGHEIGHGFDDQGSKYDGDGNLKDWWTASDRTEFDKRSKMLIDQYNEFTPAQLPGQHVNGALTIGENIGDLGGLTIAHKAYLLSLKGSQPPVLDGLSGPQRLFIGWAQVWRSKYRDAEMSRRLATDPHSPAEFRCNGVVRNLTEFYDAFDVKEGDKLWLPKDKRVRIW